MLPFTREQFGALFGVYNAAVWPMQAIAAAIGLGMAVALLRPSKAADRALPLALAALWTWTGCVFHGRFFSAINPPAWLFGAFFIVQGALFCIAAADGPLAFGPGRGARRWVGWGLLAYAAVGYPLVGRATGQGWSEIPAFGLTPCPLTLTTFGLLVLSARPPPRWLLAIPTAWALVGGTAAVLLDVPQDWALFVAPVAMAVLAALDRASRRTVRPDQPAVGDHAATVPSRTVAP